MGNQTKLKKVLESLIDTNTGVKKNSKISTEVQALQFKNHETKSVKLEADVEKNQAPADQKKTKAQKVTTQNIMSLGEEPSTNKPSVKENLKPPKVSSSQKQKQNKTNYQEVDMLKMVQARKFQMMTKSGMDQASSSSPLQMHLIQSESLRIAQDKITELEEELSEIRQKNESLVSASEVLKDKNDLLKSKLEDLKYAIKEEKDNFKDEKEILLSAMEEAKTQINQLKSKKKELEKRLSSDFHGIRNRESSLESRIEILKMETSVLQREKDKKIIDLKKQIQKIKSNLDGAHKKNQDLQIQNNNLQESTRRTVSALRATIYNLEGIRNRDETIVTKINDETKNT